MTFDQKVDRILAQATHRLKRHGYRVQAKLRWIMSREEYEFLKLPQAFDLRADARQALAQWYAARWQS